MVIKLKMVMVLKDQMVKVMKNRMVIAGRRLRRPDPAGSCRKATEITGIGSSIPTGNFSDFSDDLRPVPTEKYRELIGIHRKKSRKFPVGILLPLPAISGAFLKESARIF
jgi:hypothetical protein